MHEDKAALARQLALSPLKTFAATVFKNKECNEYMLEQATKQKTKELCTVSRPSLLRQNEKGKLISLKWDAVNDELKKRCPLFYKFLTASASNPSQKRNVHKKDEVILPPMLDAGCQLISVFNSDLDTIRRIKSVVLKKGGLKKVRFKRFVVVTNTINFNLMNYFWNIYHTEYFPSNCNIMA